MHMILFLEGAPPASVMKDCLQSEPFRKKVANFIATNITADVGLDTQALMKVQTKPSISFNRPLSPSDPQYSVKRVEQQKLLTHALQLHQCAVGRCLIVKGGRQVCKNRAPWPLSKDNFIRSDGEWGMVRSVGYVNAFNGTIQETHLCNNDIKLITNGEETKDMTFYFTAYASKKQHKSTNESAILAKRYAFHNKQEAKNKDYHQVGRRMITRCAASLSREQELSAPEVISYLMGWGDRYISHHFVPIYLDGLTAALRQTFEALQAKKWVRVTTREGTVGAVEAKWDSTAEVDSVRLTSVNGKISIQNQLQSYAFRGNTLETYNVLSFFTDTYEQSLTRGKGGDVEADENGNNSRASVRHPYRDNFRPKHGRVIRLDRHETVPQFIGRWFPRNDRPEDGLLYRLMMLAVLKPWRKLGDLVEGFRTVDEAWTTFLEKSKGEHNHFIENVQYFYHCSDQSSSRREKEYVGYEP
ncbi:hypothetical protein GG344DRAFT_82761 [Lentinula edodes]|nr:hypothetical protein GG344DRAFT_82761 [Lentinula edodes]